MRRKRIVSILLAALLALSALPCHALEAATVSGVRMSAAPGGEVEYSVCVRGNPGIASFRIFLSYDADVLTPLVTEDEEGERTLRCTQGDFTSGGVLVTNQTGTSVQVFWYDTKNAVGDGTLFTLRFLVNEDAEPGDTAIGVSCVSADTLDAQGRPVTFRCEDGAVTVRAFCPTLRPAEMSVRQGEVFDYPVYLDDDPSVAAVKLRLYFDAAVLEPVTDETGSVVCAAPVGSVSCYARQTGGYCVLTAAWWDAAAAPKSGPLFTVRLRVREDASLGDCPVLLAERFTEAKDGEEADVALAQVSGALSVCDGSEISVQISAHRAEVSVANCGAAHAIAAFYDGGRMLCARTIPLRDRCGSTVVTNQVSDLSALSWRIFLLDGAFRPICPAYDRNR